MVKRVSFLAKSKVRKKVSFTARVPSKKRKRVTFYASTR